MSINFKLNKKGKDKIKAEIEEFTPPGYFRSFCFNCNKNILVKIPSKKKFYHTNPNGEITCVFCIGKILNFKAKKHGIKCYSVKI